MKGCHLYLAPLFAWSASQFPSGLHICQVWHWNYRCRWSWRRSARQALQCICSRARDCVSRCSSWYYGDKGNTGVRHCSEDRSNTTRAKGWMDGWLKGQVSGSVSNNLGLAKSIHLQNYTMDQCPHTSEQDWRSPLILTHLPNDCNECNTSTANLGIEESQC